MSLFSISRSASRHKLPTEASKRFERGVDFEIAPVAAQRVVDILVEYGGGSASGRVSDLNNTKPFAEIVMPLHEPARLTGVEYDQETITGLLKAVGCKVRLEDGNVIARPPSWRPDLTGPAHLVEEIARLAGYDTIPSRRPRPIAGRGYTPKQRARRDAARALAQGGLVQVLSYPFIALYDAGASIFRAQENTRGPMVISIISNVMNIVGNGILIWVFHMGVAGAAISTLASRIFCAVVVLYQLRKDRQPIVVHDYLKIRPDGKMIGRILALGIPSGIENSMFQLGKLAIQSTVSTLGTTAIAAQAMTNMLEMLNGTAVIGVGIGLMTVVGQSLGAGRKDEAVYYMKKLMIFSEVFLIACCAVVYVLARPITMIGGMEAKSAEMCLDMMFWITIVKPIVWMFAFIPAYGMRAAGDVKFSMITSCITMWTFRFCLCVYLIRVCGMGPMAVWIGMFTDWTVRAIVFGLRFKSGKWMEHKVV